MLASIKGTFSRCNVYQSHLMITVVKHEITLPVPMKVVKCRSVFHIMSACFANNVQHPLEVCDQHKDHDSNMHPLPNLVVRVFCSEHCTDMFVGNYFSLHLEFIPY